MIRVSTLGLGPRSPHLKRGNSILDKMERELEEEDEMREMHHITRAKTGNFAGGTLPLAWTMMR